MDARSCESLTPSVHDTPATPPVTLTRETLGRIYRLLEQSANEEGRLPRQDSSLLAKLVKVSPGEFETALNIFAELELLALDAGKITMKKSENKKELSDSPTYRALHARPIQEVTP